MKQLVPMDDYGVFADSSDRAPITFPTSATCSKKIDLGLLNAIPDFQQRKRTLEWYAAKQCGIVPTAG
ncbi:hypothetical protein DSECCO2_547340 [anaerobic digester metagenome]